MGVSKLWDVLEPIKEEISLSELSRLTVAIDLSGWIVQSQTASRNVTVNGTYLMLRTLVYRIVNIIRHGIKPVFILDGEAPGIKSATLDKRQKQQGHYGNSSTDRHKLRNCSEKCIELLEALGLPYIVYQGEAEKLCALLNASGKVDGCISDDSDCFLYGAKIVYRNYDQTKKGSTVERYRLIDIEDKLHLTQRDMIVYALLSGCDFNDSGVQGIGQKKTLGLIQTLKSTHNDVLTRILSWRSSKEIKLWKNIQLDLTKITKNRHCKHCLHTGSVDIHKKYGCSICKTSTACILANSKDCSCDWHNLFNQIQHHHKEIDICDKALKNPHFPDVKIVGEFLEEDKKGSSDVILKWLVPDFRRLTKVVKKYLNWDDNDMIKVILPTVVFQVLYDILPSSTSIIIPIQIIRSCQDNFTLCYEVKWKLQTGLLGSVKGAQSDIIVKIEKALFQSKYPKIVDKFDKQEEEKKSSKKKGKRKKNEAAETQTTIKSYFTARKKLKFDEPSSGSKTVTSISETAVIEIE